MQTEKSFAVMQPYFLPYIGYFQLMQHVDTFVFADDYQYSKSGWINRNQISVQGRTNMVTLPIKKSFEKSRIIERSIAQEFEPKKMLRKFQNAYGKNSGIDSKLFDLLNFDNNNLGEFLMHSLCTLAAYLNIEVEILRTSQLEIPSSLSGKEKIIYLAKKLAIPNYINLPGGKQLYNKSDFIEMGVKLNFLEPNESLFKEGRFSIAHNLYTSTGITEIEDQLRLYKIV